MQNELQIADLDPRIVCTSEHRKNTHTQKKRDTCLVNLLFKVIDDKLQKLKKYGKGWIFCRQDKVN